MKLPVLHKDKNTNTTIYIVIAIVIVFAIYRIYQKAKEIRTEMQATSPSIGGGTTSTGTTPNTTSAPTYNNKSVFSTKNAATKIDRVQWIQNAYNKYAKARKTFGKTPDWKIISEDGKYGSNTEKAMVTLMGSKTTSWEAVKTRTEYLTAQLTPDYSNYNWQ